VHRLQQDREVRVAGPARGGAEDFLEVAVDAVAEALQQLHVVRLLRNHLLEDLLRDEGQAQPARHLVPLDRAGLARHGLAEQLRLQPEDVAPHQLHLEEAVHGHRITPAEEGAVVRVRLDDWRAPLIPVDGDVAEREVEEARRIVRCRGGRRAEPGDEDEHGGAPERSA
jgi:hypothetical protein